MVGMEMAANYAMDREAPMRHMLVERAQDGDHDAFAALIHDRIDRLYGLAGLITGDRTRAEDAVQDALLRAWRDLPRLRDRERFDAWLRRLVVNASHDQGRRVRRRAEVAFDPEHATSVPDASEQLAHRDELERGFARITPSDRSVIALRYYLSLSTAEAAEVLGVREVALRSRLHRALSSLRHALSTPEMES